MPTAAPAKIKRSNPPLCARCSHSKSFHGGGEGPCKAIGCKGCDRFVPREAKSK